MEFTAQRRNDILLYDQVFAQQSGIYKLAQEHRK